MEKENRRSKRTIRNIRNALLMVCVSVAMLSTATYAWFTVTDTPSVTGLKMTAASKGGLEISDTRDSGYSNLLEISEQVDDHMLSPVSPVGDGEFGAPIYSGNGSVDGVTSAIGDDELEEDYLAKYTYYLRSTGGTVNVGLMGGDDGSWIKEESKKSTNNGAYAIRVGFLAESGEWIIYEPNEDKSESGTTAPTTMSEVKGDIQQKEDGDFSSGGSGTKSDKMFEVGTTGKEIEMYIWLEGTDPECANEIMLAELEGQIQFTVVN